MSGFYSALVLFCAGSVLMNYGGYSAIFFCSFCNGVLLVIWVLYSSPFKKLDTGLHPIKEKLN